MRFDTSAAARARHFTIRAIYSVSPPRKCAAQMRERIAAAQMRRHDYMFSHDLGAEKTSACIVSHEAANSGVLSDIAKK